MVSQAEWVPTLQTKPSFWRALLERLHRLRDSVWWGTFGHFGYKSEPPDGKPSRKAPPLMAVASPLSLTVKLSDGVEGRIEPPMNAGEDG